MNHRPNLRAAQSALHGLRLQYASFPAAQATEYTARNERNALRRAAARQLLGIWHDPARAPGCDPYNDGRGVLQGIVSVRS